MPHERFVVSVGWGRFEQDPGRFGKYLIGGLDSWLTVAVSAQNGSTRNKTSPCVGTVDPTNFIAFAWMYDDQSEENGWSCCRGSFTPLHLSS